MKKDKICIADYISSVDQKSKPIGHAKKVLIENCEWLSDQYEVTCAASKEYLEDIDDMKKKKLPFKTIEGNNYSGLWGRAKKIFISWINIFCCFYNGGYVWFDNIDILLVLYLYFHPVKCKRTVISLYTNCFEKKYHNYMLKSISHRVKLLITSSKVDMIDNSLYIPDYLYKQDIYGKYLKNTKVNDFICLGLMSRDKDLEGLIQCFNNRKEKLFIVGHFTDKEWFERLKAIASINVQLLDIYLDYDVYLTLLSKFKFSILPYSGEVYAKKTSGVVLESIFLKTIPVTYKKLLENWNVKGIGYDKIENIWKQDMSDSRVEEIISYNSAVIEEQFEPNVYLKKVCDKLG